MNGPDTSLGGRGRDFPSTSWGLVLRAADPEDPARREHLERLIRLYWKPAYFYLRAAGRRSVEDAKDLAQAFFARLLEKEHLSRLDSGRGSFRGFLKRALKNFLVDSSRREAARRPSAGAELFRFEDLRDEPLEADADPERLFEREWARAVLRASLEQMEQRAGGTERARDFDVFRSYCLGEGRRTYRDVGRALGMEEAEVRRRLIRCREELRSIVRERIREYAAGEDDAEAEYREILGP